MKKKINWGILGPGKIARKFADDLRLVSDARLLAVGSRSMRSAQNFAQEYNVERIYDSYTELVKDDDIDVIYIATPHTFHHEQTLLCLNHGKHVLCEKPIAVNSLQLQEMIHLAQSKNLFLMEALWTDFLPSITKVKQLVKEGLLGDVKYITADFGFLAPKDLSSRIYDPYLAGGALLDVGIYPVYLAIALLGEPAMISSHAHMTGTGVDGTTAIMMSWKSGAVAQLHASVELNTLIEARIYGENRHLLIPRRWHESKKIELYENNELTDEWSFNDHCKGYKYEIEEVHNCINNGITESSSMSLSKSQLLLSTLDKIRRQIGLAYPFE